MTNSLMHYGVKKQKWGVRRYQYEDKSLTPEGRIHYGVGEPRKQSRTEKKAEKNLRRSRAEREYLQRQRQDIFDSMDRDKKDFTFEGWEDTVKERDYWKKLYDEETDPEVKKWWKDEIRELDDQLYEYEENAAFMKAKQKDYT